MTHDTAAGSDRLGACATSNARSVTVACRVRIALSPGAAGRNHCDAIDRARRDAKLATRAQRGQYDVHRFARAENRIDRARVDAKRAADATPFVDLRDGERRVRAASGIERANGSTRDRRERGNRCIAPRRATIDIRYAVRDRIRVRTAGGITTASALRLRQCGIEAFGECWVHSPIVMNLSCLSRSDLIDRETEASLVERSAPNGAPLDSRPAS